MVPSPENDGEHLFSTRVLRDVNLRLAHLKQNLYHSDLSAEIIEGEDHTTDANDTFQNRASPSAGTYGRSQKINARHVITSRVLPDFYQLAPLVIPQ